jgi:hypothetical protein
MTTDTGRGSEKSTGNIGRIKYLTPLKETNLSPEIPKPYNLDRS